MQPASWQGSTWPGLLRLKASTKVSPGTKFQAFSCVQYCSWSFALVTCTQGASACDQACGMAGQDCHLLPQRFACAHQLSHSQAEGLMAVPAAALQAGWYQSAHRELAGRLRNQCEHGRLSCQLPGDGSVMASESTSCRKSGMPLRSGQRKPRLSKKGTTSASGPWKMVRPA